MDNPLKEVKERMAIFTGGHRQAQYDAADLIDSICQSLGYDYDHRKRVRDAVMGVPRKKIRFSEARKRLGLTDYRSWNAMCDKDPRYSEVEIIKEAKNSAYCWEDEVNALLAKLNDKNERAS